MADPFLPRRKKNGKIVVGRYYVVRIPLPNGGFTQKSLRTSDLETAKKLARDIEIELHREAAGLIAPKAMREAASMSLGELVAEYKSDLVARELKNGHVRDTIGRIRRALKGLKWTRLANVRADQFVAWRSQLVASAKTKKEYQVSLNAFLNWLVRLGRLASNPLATVGRVETRGKDVRKSRAFNVEEFRALLAASGRRRLAYLFMVYTGTRKNEARSLVWEDIRENGDGYTVRVRIETAKDKESRVIPLHPQLADELLKSKPSEAKPTDQVFDPFPSYDGLLADFRRAGIERKDVLGRVLHFHAFRKTFQTWGASCGVGQRAAQEILGHSDPSLTANVYTDVSAMALHSEVAKLPWYGSPPSLVSLQDSQKDPQKRVRLGFLELLRQLIELAQVVAKSPEAKDFGVLELAARHGFEP